MRGDALLGFDHAGLPEAEYAALLGVRGNAQHIRASEQKRLKLCGHGHDLVNANPAFVAMCAMAAAYRRTP